MGGDERSGGEKAAQFLERARVQGGPGGVRVPMARKIGGRAQVPAGGADGVKDFAAVGEGARGQRDFLAGIVERRIVRDARDEIPAREKEMRVVENARCGHGRGEGGE